jgi:hypothetical protein
MLRIATTSKFNRCIRVKDSTDRNKGACRSDRESWKVGEKGLGWSEYYRWNRKSGQRDIRI